MFIRLTNKIGKPLCAALYGFFIYLASKKKYIPLLALFAMHATEYFAIGRKTGREHKTGTIKALAYCLAFGFTWWLPIRVDAKKKGENK